MPKEITPKQWWQFYEKLPEELKRAVFSEEAAKNIYDICERNEIDIDLMPEVSRYVGRVLIGILPPDDFQETLEKELKIEKDIAKRITHEINRLIFAPVKESLSKVYKIKVTVPEEIPSVKPAVTEPGAIPSEEKPKREDIYREPLE